MSLLVSFLLWLDALPVRYWACVDATSGLLVASAFLAFWRPQSVSRWNRPVVFALLLGLALLAFRWPLLFDNRAGANPDESQMIAGAIVLKSQPVFWRFVDGTTHGPLVQLPLAALGMLGMRLDYTNARLLSLFLTWVVVVGVWLTARVPFGDGLARVLTLPVAMLEITVEFWDFTQYSSEHVPIALLAVATALIVAALFGRHPPRPLALAAAGVLLGAAPFAKLQATPVGLWLGLGGLALLLGDARSSWPVRLRRAAWLAGGALVVPGLALVALATWGGLNDFWISYLQTNLVYTQQIDAGFSESLANLLKMIHQADSFREFWHPLAWLIPGALLVRLCWHPRDHLRFSLFIIGLLLSAAYATVAPHRIFTHYLQFLVGPLGLAFAAFTAPTIERLRLAATNDRRWLQPVASIALVAVTLAACAGLLPSYRFRELDRTGRFSQTRGKLVKSDLGRRVESLTTASDTVAIWGWEPRLFVEANRRHATRVAHTALELFASPYRDYYRQRYLRDFRRNRPAVFVDVTGPGSFYFDDRGRYGHETYAALAQEIARRYRLIAEIDSGRVYLRNDRPAPAWATTASSAFHAAPH